jgi:hypothetical protein
MQKQQPLQILSICTLRYAECKAHALYYIVICNPSDCTKFFTLSHTRHAFVKNVIEFKMCALIFFLQLA